MSSFNFIKLPFKRFQFSAWLCFEINPTSTSLSDATNFSFFGFWFLWFLLKDCPFFERQKSSLKFLPFVKNIRDKDVFVVAHPPVCWEIAKKGRFCIYNTFPCWCIISTIWRWYLLPSAFLFINSNEILLLFPLALILVNSQYIYPFKQCMILSVYSQMFLEPKAICKFKYVVVLGIDMLMVNNSWIE